MSAGKSQTKTFCVCFGWPPASTSGWMDLGRAIHFGKLWWLLSKKPGLDHATTPSNGFFMFKYCVYDPDPNGNDRYYVRKPGHKKIRIKETFQDAGGRITPEFMKAYFAALDGLEEKHEPPQTPGEKTFYWLVDQYYRSPKFKSFDPLTQADKRSVLDRFCKAAGNLPYAAFRRDDVERSQEKRRETPAAADKLVKYLRSLFVWAIKNGHATFNPAVGVEKIHETDGWHAWTVGMTISIAAKRCGDKAPDGGVAGAADRGSIPMGRGADLFGARQ